MMLYFSHWAQHRVEAWCCISLIELSTWWKHDVVLLSLSSAWGGGMMLYFPSPGSAWGGGRYNIMLPSLSSAQGGGRHYIVLPSLSSAQYGGIMLYFPHWGQHRLEDVHYVVLPPLSSAWDGGVTVVTSLIELSMGWKFYVALLSLSSASGGERHCIVLPSLSSAWYGGS